MLFNYCSKNNLPLDTLTINEINEQVLNKINEQKIKSLIIVNDDLNKICDLIESLKENVVIYTKYKKKINNILKERYTYQGFNRSVLNEVKRQMFLNLKSTDYVIDATIGNGYDTETLARLVPKGKVFGFDIQEAALLKTKERVSNFSNVYLYLMSHEYIDKLDYDQKIKLVVFNLGYLPGNNKNITTKSSSTIKAISKALNLLSNDGLILVTIYPGHEEGLKESILINKYLKNNNINYLIKRNTNKKEAPYLIIIYKNNN